MAARWLGVEREREKKHKFRDEEENALGAVAADVLAGHGGGNGSRY